MTIPEAQPGQEQRMDNAPITREEMIEMFGSEMPIEAVNLVWNSDGEKTCGELRAELRSIAATRPTADLGEDGELERELHNEAHDLANRLPARQAMEAAADRLILYREALELFVRAACPVATEINPRGHNWTEAYLDEALSNARAVLSRSGG